ncbi:hypothetical protein DSO57_1032852 [Entomophthora muscae]|uniref:Uncharacterized protein n=1 Tax=Entomophthora muscae TaxID=34485 RepID=A0ACC2TNB7_9FUNG|nr:hypothetical protein DSO57_1032852 [Entomophthora muscae]
MVPVAEGATGETIIITRDGDEVAEVATFTPSWFYGGYQSLVAPIKQINKNQINKIVQQNMNIVVNAAIHSILILPLVGHFEDKSLAFAFTT